MTQFYRTFLQLALFAAICTSPSLAHAKAFGEDASGDFSDSEKVGDKDLAKMRGGFLNINGLLLDISYSAVIAVNGTVQSNISINTSDLQQAVQNGQPLQTLPPAIVQNVDNNALITMQQQLDVTLQGAAAQAAAHSQIHQMNFQSMLAH